MYKELIEAIATKDTVTAQQLINEMDISELMANDNGSALFNLIRYNHLSSVCDTFIDKLTNQATSEVNDCYKPLIKTMAENLKNMIYTSIDLSKECEEQQNSNSSYTDHDIDVLGR